MTDRARELLERTAEILELLFEGPNDVDPNTLAMLGDTRLEEIRAYLAQQEVKREALSDDEVDSLFTCDETSPEYEHGFRDGIWFAEKHHGIGGDDGNNK